MTIDQDCKGKMEKGKNSRREKTITSSGNSIKKAMNETQFPI